MGTQQSRSGHGRQGSQQQGQQSGNRPQQERDLQRNKQSDRGQQRQQGGEQGKQVQQAQPGRQNVHGEGNYAASRQYNDATKEYTQSGRVESAAREAAPESDAEARRMSAAEAEGKRHAKGEDPALTRRPSEQSPESKQTPRPGHEEE